MIRIREIALPPEHSVHQLPYEAARLLKVNNSKIRKLSIVRRSVDARKKPDVKIVYTIDVAVDGNEQKILRQSGFSVLPPVQTLKQLSARYSTSECSVGSGWLLSAEIAGWAQTGYPKVLAALPFACLPGHIYGRGQYAALQRRLPGSLIVGIDYDASIRDGTVQTRIQMLLDEPV